MSGKKILSDSPTSDEAAAYTCKKTDTPLIVLTGAAGRLGVPVYQALLEAGKKVRAVDWASSPSQMLPIIKANLSRRADCCRVLKDADILIHLAYRHDEEGYPERVFSEHMLMNQELFQAAVKAGIKKIIFASSMQVISPQTPNLSAKTHPLSLPLDENSLAQPDNWYSLAKRCSEEMLAMIQRVHGIDVVILRFPVLTPREPQHHENWFKGRLSEGFGFLTYQDATELVLKIIDTELSGFRIYVPASLKNSLRRMVPEIVHDFYQGVTLSKPVEEIRSLIDCSSLTRDTGWEPRDLGGEDRRLRQPRMDCFKKGIFGWMRKKYLIK